jgi:hypothetical protein
VKNLCTSAKKCDPLNNSKSPVSAFSKNSIAGLYLFFSLIKKYLIEIWHFGKTHHFVLFSPALFYGVTDAIVKFFQLIFTAGVLNLDNEFRTDIYSIFLTKKYIKQD